MTVDVEADMPRWEIEEPLTFRNIEALPAFQRLCSRHGMRPTYLVEHAITEDRRATRILRGLQQTGECEIGAHLHPWSSPPYAPGERQRIEYPSNLPTPRLAAKLARVTAALRQAFGTQPVSYRAGKFGLSPATPALLADFGYEADTSITPMVDWREQGGPNFLDEHVQPRILMAGQPPVVEVPVSVAFTRRLPPLLQRLYLRAPRRLHLRGLLGSDYLNWIDLAWLYPACFTRDQMIAGCDRLVADGVPVLNIFLHSSELAPGESPYTRTPEEVRAYLERLFDLVEHARQRHAARGETLAEFTRRYRKETGCERPGHLVAGYR
jgi:hypothetical protein